MLTSLHGDKTEVNDMVVHHARQTVDRLHKSSQVISAEVKDSSTAVIGVAYRLEGGRAQPITESALL